MDDSFIYLLLFIYSAEESGGKGTIIKQECCRGGH
jgi:hypothetical protein